MLSAIVLRPTGVACDSRYAEFKSLAVKQARINWVVWDFWIKSD
jgi:hypothetical protein